MESMENSIKKTTCTAEASKYGILVASGLDTGRMVMRALATTSTYILMVSLKLGKDTGKMEVNGTEARGITKMVLISSMTADADGEQLN